MKQVFVTSISLQAKRDLQKVLYHPVDFKLEKNVETSFPIVPVIYSCAEGRKEDLEVIAVRSENQDTPDNFQKLLQELEAIGVEKDQVKEFVIPEISDNKNSVRLLLGLIDMIPDDSLVYCDITFNTKPISIMLTYAMHLVEMIKDVEVQGIFYGHMPRKDGKIVLERVAMYDLTVFKSLLDMTDRMKILGIQDIRKIIGDMVDL